jgi:hypothetical protein
MKGLQKLTNVELVQYAVDAEVKYEEYLKYEAERAVKDQPSCLETYAKKSGLVQIVVESDKEMLARKLWCVLTSCRLDVKKALAFIELQKKTKV